MNSLVNLEAMPTEDRSIYLAIMNKLFKDIEQGKTIEQAHNSIWLTVKLAMSASEYSYDLCVTDDGAK